MLGELERIARQCDGVRCDMAMLVLPDVFQRTWGIAAGALLAAASRRRCASSSPGFLFMAEVYWDLEWTLQQQGFDYTYDKRLYDRLRAAARRAPVREHLLAGLDFQDRLARFLENHDEPRAAATFAPEVHRAAAVDHLPHARAALLPPGQREGRKVRISMHLGAGRPSARRRRSARSTTRLLACLKDRAFRDGRWQLLDARPAWEGNGSNDAFVVFAWTGPGDQRRVVAVNYARPPEPMLRRRCRGSDLAGRRWRLRDRLGAAVYERDGADSRRAAFISTCRRGDTTPSRCSRSSGASSRCS